ALLDPNPVFEKRMFSARECSKLVEDWHQRKLKNILLTGMETHVCVMQSAFDLMSKGFEVFVCIDAVSSRNEEDDMTAMQRMESCGATLVTTEMALFEWCETSNTEEFKAISKIVQREFTGHVDDD
ncbi:MAG: isochorismatase family protein, partial [Planctomycetota bacterium]